MVETEYECNYENLDLDAGDDHTTDAVEVQRNDKTKPINQFDKLPSLVLLAPICASNKLQHYLESDPKDMKDATAWWHDHHTTYPCLS
ncbi:hypothetical protein APHAL10511_007467 [Amanita phalloides]|nr:hypothetical protein APHAL10511_007467 [Amanita phalloides]